MIERRYGILQVSAEFLIQLCKGEGAKAFEIEKHGLPTDAQIRGCGIDANPAARFSVSAGLIEIIVESASFAPVPEGQPIPVLPSPAFKLFGIAPAQEAASIARCPSCGEDKPMYLGRCEGCGWERKRK